MLGGVFRIFAVESAAKVTDGKKTGYNRLQRRLRKIWSF
jgi:hypothetical protein